VWWKGNPVVEPVEVVIEGRVAIVRLNRPEKHNALDRESFAAIIKAGERLAGDASVRVAILTGAGESFCAGLDRSLFESHNVTDLAGDAMQPLAGTGANFYQHAALIWRDLPIPVIAAVHGVAYGAGLQVALGADLRIAAPQSRFSIMEIRWGIIPDMGITVSLRHIVAADRIKLLAFTGNVIDGTEALRQGFVTELHVEPLAAARLLAQQIARHSPQAVRAVKTLLNRSLDESVERALRSEAELQLTLLGSPDQKEAVIANLHKREPRFRYGEPGQTATE
jgi:enoyl-CoA hydratase/carnithine racemase